MKWSSLPPLAPLKAFAAYADTGSVSAAGARLNVSHAAISQHIRQLEGHLNVALVDRSGRQMVLTLEGRALATALLDGFGTIADAVEALSEQEDQRPLQISCTPSFASCWLMPRLARFREEHGNIDMMIDPNPNLVTLTPGGIDVAIRYGTGGWPGLENRALFPAQLVLVGAPVLFPDKVPHTNADLEKLPWLNELGTNEASLWLERKGLKRDQITSITDAPGNLVLDGLRSGQGIAVVTRLAVAEDIASGRLIILHEENTGASYHLLTRPGLQRPALRAFCRWILDEARKT